MKNVNWPFDTPSKEVLAEAPHIMAIYNLQAAITVTKHALDNAYPNLAASFPIPKNVDDVNLHLAANIINVATMLFICTEHYIDVIEAQTRRKRR